MNHGGRMNLGRLSWYHNFQWPKVWLSIEICFCKCLLGYHVDWCLADVFAKGEDDNRNVRLIVHILWLRTSLTYFTQAWGVNKHGLPQLLKKNRAA